MIDEYPAPPACQRPTQIFNRSEFFPSHLKVLPKKTQAGKLSVEQFLNTSLESTQQLPSTHAVQWQRGQRSERLRWSNTEAHHQTPSDK